MSGGDGIAWEELAGDPQDIRFARRDLAGLKAAIGYCRERRHAVQAGGALGVFPLYLLQHFASVDTFEPDPDTFELLCENCFPPSERLRKHLAALGEHAGEGYLCRSRREGGAGHSGTYHMQLHHVAGGLPSDIETVDRLGLVVCDLLYLDVEGFELYALRGSRRTLERCRPVVGVEINKNLTALGLKPADIGDYLKGLGYRAVCSILSDTIFVPERG